MIAVQKGITAAVCCCVCEMVAFHRGICTFGASFIRIFCSILHLSVISKVYCNLWCLIISYRQLGAYHSKEHTTLNSVVVIAQNISAAWRVERTSLSAAYQAVFV